MKKILSTIVTFVATLMISSGAFAQEDGRLTCTNGDYQSQVVFSNNWTEGVIYDNRGGEFHLINLEWADNVGYAQLVLDGEDGKPVVLNYQFTADRIESFQGDNYLGGADCVQGEAAPVERIENLKAGNGTDMWIYYDRNIALVTSDSKYFHKQWRFIKEGQTPKLTVKYTNTLKNKYKRSDFEWTFVRGVIAVEINGVKYIQINNPAVAELDLDVAKHMVIGTKTGFNFWYQAINLDQ